MKQNEIRYYYWFWHINQIVLVINYDRCIILFIILEKLDLSIGILVSIHNADLLFAVLIIIRVLIFEWILIKKLGIIDSFLFANLACYFLSPL